jgi:hypothetical protein
MKGAVLLPRARVDGLVIRQLADESLIYDRKRDEAHCLNQTAALVWKHCDGKTSAEQIAALLHEQLGETVDVDLVWLAIKQLRSFHLIENDEGLKDVLPFVTRRKLLLKYAPAALALPLIISIVAPTAAQGTSPCKPGLGDPCNINTLCCPGFSCDLSVGQCVPAPPPLS